MSHPSDKPPGEGASHEPANGDRASEFARVTRALKTLSAGNRTLLRASDELELLHEMCRLIVDSGGYRLAAVAFAERDARKHIRWIASVGMEATVLQNFNFTWADTELGRGVTATAIRTGEPVVGRHLLTDPEFAGPAYAPVHKVARQMGWASLTAFPLRVEGEVLGALAIAAAEPDAFDAAEVTLLSELADDLVFGIAILRTRLKHSAAQATITRLAHFDTLTGLPTRALFLDLLEVAIDAARGRHGTMALLHLGVGRFREINKVLGYRSGNALLQEIGRRLAIYATPDATLARVGETEFAVLLPDAGARAATELAQQLAMALDLPCAIADIVLDSRVGIGIALFPDHATNADALFRRSTAALQQSRLVRGGYAMYRGGQEKEATRRLALMGDLHRAIRQDELCLYCQPKVEFASRKVCGAEALVRWRHPMRGMISPAEFIPLAEHTGVITPLTNWILEAAFRHGHAWREAGREQPLAVNLSALNLYDHGFVDRVRGMFSTWGMAPELIQFELTESALMVDPSEALATLEQLKGIGVQIFIDDFGTGHSSLSYLQRLPVDAIKIDQSFVMRMVASADSAIIVRSTIELGHNLGLKVVAEGVENDAVWERLGALGCDVAQGYFISTPMPAEQFEAWERTWRLASSGVLGCQLP